MEKLVITIKRQDKTGKKYTQQIEYTGNLKIPVTTLLEKINNQEEIKDINGKEIQPIKWSCSCLQGLCGACAMLINGWPKLACKTFVDEEVMTKHFHKITIEPLSKFKVIEDLKVDRSKLYETMKDMSQWIESDAKVGDVQFQYEMSLCLMCGICMEGCPNYFSDKSFKGTPVAVSSAKLAFQEQNEKHRKKIEKEYKKNFYNGCVKSMICEDICPMEIPTQQAISKMNRKSVWHMWHLLKKE
ncbi:2Fe-2S iron-sulfur cluster-binding protein [Methanosphaera sp. WGK6]|uniref:2Fe-2S iron-sulfur cluster-binding protein n=1 Tax=Methanosphaera sp. WGK6 TaxID=1561964 RepID=UPI00084C57FE|nr:2Fe-2S iron-sulfur cluster-binding protein [Methanosphaera sp. WGK6]OED30024.1 hypothetical protein NL43_04695 [Methanosphaera sp. WGK6]